MVRQVIWSDRSLELLKDILKYWAERNGSEIYSAKLYSLFQLALKQLAKYPESDRLTENIKIRYKKVRTYYIYFTYTETSLKVIAISHVKRSPTYIDSFIN